MSLGEVSKGVSDVNDHGSFWDGTGVNLKKKSVLKTHPLKGKWRELSNENI